MSDVTIPEGVMQASLGHLAAALMAAEPGGVVSSVDVIARAILAERERCAKIADAEFEAMKLLDMKHYKILATKSAEICGAKARTAQFIAKAIRSSHE